MKVYLDDLRATPVGWVRAYWPTEVISLLETGAVEELSLDHDLGDDARGTGYDVILWIEEAVALRGFAPPCIVVHSANAAAAARMNAGIRAIEALQRRGRGVPRLPQNSLDERLIEAARPETQERPAKFVRTNDASPRKRPLMETLVQRPKWVDMRPPRREAGGQTRPVGETA